MDIKKGKLNVSVSIVFKIITMVAALVAKSTLVSVCGNGVNGLNALYVSIIGVLSVAELGIGSAISFSMYKPIVEGDSSTVSALYRLFKKLYFIVGIFIFLAGLAIMPFLSFFAKDFAEISVNIYVSFLLILVSVVITYMFGARLSLINAYKNNYVTTVITQGGLAFQYCLQIVVLYLTHSFVWYLISRIVSAIFQWIMAWCVTRKKYGVIITESGILNKETKSVIKRNVKAMFMHKIGYMLVNTVDGIIISVFAGVISLGEYSNYILILTSMTSIISLVFSSLTSVIGHLCVEEQKSTARKFCESFHLLNCLIGMVFFLGYYAIVDNLISILFAADLVVVKSMSFTITLNGFIKFMRNAALTFKDATGAFYSDRWKPLIEGITNIILSIIFVKIVGVVGVIIATIITNLAVCHIIEPYVLYKHSFSSSPRSYYIKNYGMILVFLVALALLSICMQSMENDVLELLTNGTISVVISLMASFFIILMDANEAKTLIQIFKRR